MAGRSVASLDVAGVGQSGLGAVLRHGTGEDFRELRIAGRVSVSSGTARLVGRRVYASDGQHCGRWSTRRAVGYEGDSETDRNERYIPAVFASDFRTGRT